MCESYKKWLEEECPKLYCQCGCNKEIIIKKHHKRFGIPNYLQGHYWKNRSKSNEQKSKISKTRIENGLAKKENNPMFGKKHSSEAIKKMRQAHFGKKHSPEIIEKMSESHKRENLSEETLKIMSIVNSGENNGMYGIHRFAEENPNWKGGIAYLPYCYKFNNKLKEKVRERDGRICQECDKTELENGKKLSVHHIHYDKENCYPDLISLCCSCNSKVNGNREYWEGYFMGKLKERNLLGL